MKKRIILLVILLFILFPVSFDNQVLNNKNIPPVYQKVLLTEHPRIVIANHSHFFSVAEQEHWNGSGTVGDPFIIENYLIHLQDDKPGIDIWDSRHFFIIKNVQVVNSTFVWGAMRLKPIPSERIVSCWPNTG